MFFIIPLVIFIIAIFVGGYVIYIKLPYLRKVSPEVMMTSHTHQGFWAELVPSLFGPNVRQNLRKSFVEFLKSLSQVSQWIRKVWQTFDSLTDKIGGVLRRKGNETAATAVSEMVSIQMSKSVTDKESIKHQEQDLIIQIAQNPKNPQLYEKLGKIYLELGEIDDARQSFMQALEFDPASVSIKQELDKILKKSNN